MSILCIRGIAYPGQTSHLRARPHAAGLLGEKPCVPAGIGAEIDLLDAEERGAILVLVLFEGFKEREGRDEAGGPDRSVKWKTAGDSGGVIGRNAAVGDSRASILERKRVRRSTVGQC